MSNEPFQIDTTWHTPPGMSKGRIPRDYGRTPFGALPGASPFDIPLIPRSEWPDRIADMERTKSRLSDVVLDAGIPSLDQNGTNYCWCNAVVTAIVTLRAVMGLPYVALSPASVAAPIKNYSNQGGWGGEALDYIVKNGVAAASIWPANAIKKQYDTPEMRINAALHKVTEWYELEAGNFDQLVTCNLLRIPSPIGLNWWSHEVCAMDAVMLGPNQFGIRIRNSWTDTWKDHGFDVLPENKATPDDAVAPRVTMASLV